MTTKTTKTTKTTVTGKTVFEVEDKLRAEGISLKRIWSEPHRIAGTDVWIVELTEEDR